MEGLLQWMERAGAISKSRRFSIVQAGATGRTDEELYRAMAAKVRTSSPLPEPSATPATPTRLMDDLRNGIALAKLATKLNKSIT